MACRRTSAAALVISRPIDAQTQVITTLRACNSRRIQSGRHALCANRPMQSCFCPGSLTSHTSRMAHVVLHSRKPSTTYQVSLYAAIRMFRM